MPERREEFATDREGNDLVMLFAIDFNLSYAVYLPPK